MFREGHSQEQLDAMNEALIALTQYSHNYKQAKQFIAEERTAFFQPWRELYELAKARVDRMWDKHINGWEAFVTQKDCVEKRITRRFRDGYSYLDDREYIGKIEILDYKAYEDADECDETTTLVYVGRIIENNTNEKEFFEALRDHFGGSSCTHDYDCCGCWHYHVRRVQKIHLGSQTLFKAVVGGSRNY